VYTKAPAKLKGVKVLGKIKNRFFSVERLLNQKLRL